MMPLFWAAVGVTVTAALLVILINDAMESEDRTGALRRGWAKVRRVRLRSPVSLAAA